MTGEELNELQEALDEIKHAWSTGNTMEIPAPLERARSLVSQLEDDEDDNGREYVDCIHDTVMAEELYPREEMKQMALNDAEPVLNQFDVTTDEAKIRWLMFEDGVLHYKIDHDNIPRMKVV